MTNINDYVHIDYDEFMRLYDLCQQLKTTLPDPVDPDADRAVLDMFSIPGDIFTANTIPLRHLCIVFEGKQFAVDVLEDNAGVAASCWKNGQSEFGVGYAAKSFNDRAALDKRCVFLNGVKLTEAEANTYEAFQAVQVCNRILHAWYSLQIMLLNPYVKDVFRTVDKKETHFNPNGKKRKYRVCYVRHHYLNPEAQIGLGTTADGGKMRHTLAWYVCGHWRHYSDGKVIFIQPYWKGPLRETKACEPRERVVNATITA